ncbi:MAG: hypothetical protein R3D55_05620 [Chloroflexota bacterium]
MITIHGVQEDMRRDLSWLPRQADLVFHFRETEHGVKALYRGGHLLEFAVFNEDELQMARLNRYRVLLDKAGLAPAWLNWQWQPRILWFTAVPTHKRFAEFLMNIFVGVGRQARGEALSARQFIKRMRSLTCCTCWQNACPPTSRSCWTTWTRSAGLSRCTPCWAQS